MSVSEIIKKIPIILKKTKTKNVKWIDNIDLYNLAEQGLLYELDHVNKNLEDIKSEKMDLLEKGYSSYIINNNTENTEITEITENKTLQKKKISYSNLAELCKKKDSHGCENFIEELMIFDNSLKNK